MTHDWNFEPDDECDICGCKNCECVDTHEPGTIEEYLGEQ